MQCHNYPSPIQRRICTVCPFFFQSLFQIQPLLIPLLFLPLWEFREKRVFICLCNFGYRKSYKHFYAKKHMNFTIKNKDYCAKIEETGAELSSLFYIPTGTEYLWQKEKGIWENSAPILFPIVGRLKGGGYYYNGKRYDMDIHGFAKDSKFEILLKNQDNLVLHLEDNGLTHKQYPFSFSLDVSFSLLSNGIKVSYRVQNLGNETMYFSIG